MKIDFSSIRSQTLENNNHDFTSLKIGQLIKGKINQVKNDVFIIELSNGKLLQAKTMIPINYHENQIVQFRVKQMKENQLIIQPMQEPSDHQEIIDTIEKKIIHILKGLKIKPEQEEIDLVKKFIINKIPVNRENIEKVIQAKSCFEKIESLLNAKTIKINEKLLNENIREVLKNLLKGECAFKENLKNSLNKDLVSTYIHKNIHEYAQEEKDFNKQINAQNINIQNIDFEKIIFLLKNQLKINISNITNVNNLIIKDFTITKQMEELEKLLQENDQTNHFSKGIEVLSSKMKNMVFEKNFEPGEIIKEMYIKIELIRQSIENIDSKEKDKILNNITNLKNSLDFINKLNQFQTYVQIPILINNEDKNLDLLISKKNKKKIDLKDVKILVTLDTKNMDTVKVLVEIKDKSITCNFKVTTEETKKKISKFEKKLKDILILLGYDQVNMRYAVIDFEKNVLDFNISNDEFLNKINNIDVKV